MTKPETVSKPDESQLFGGDDTTLAERLYCQMMDRLVDRQSTRHARLRLDAEQFLRRLDPQDAIEQMLAEQMLWMHARLAYLNYYAVIQTRNRPMHVLHQAADRLANTLRRHAAAFADYRNPDRKRFTAVRQANIAHQQIVTNTTSAHEAQLHEPDLPRSIPKTPAPTLPPLAPRPGCPSPQHPSP